MYNPIHSQLYLIHGHNCGRCSPRIDDPFWLLVVTGTCLIHPYLGNHYPIRFFFFQRGGKHQAGIPCVKFFCFSSKENTPNSWPPQELSWCVWSGARCKMHEAVLGMLPKTMTRFAAGQRFFRRFGDVHFGFYLSKNSLENRYSIKTLWCIQ